MDWEILIKRVDNGYKLSWKEEIEENIYLEREYVIQDDDKDELKSGEELLWQVIEFFALYGSKHDTERIRIVREKGGN